MWEHVSVSASVCLILCAEIRLGGGIICEMGWMTGLDSFAKTAGPWVHELNSCDSSRIAESVPLRGRIVRLRGSAMQDFDSLLREYSREFRFPEYVGANWDAFFECMTELEGFPAVAYLTVIEDGDLVLAQEPAERDMFLRQLGLIGQYWGRSFGLGPEWGGGEVPFHTVLLEDRGSDDPE